MNSHVEIFLQGDGVTDIAMVSASASSTVADLLAQLNRSGAADGDLLVFLEDVAGPLDADAVVEELLPLKRDTDDGPGALRLHLARCRRVNVTVRFNGEDEARRFPPSATVERIHRWATRRAFEMSPRDAAEHLLQVYDTTVRPDRDVHVGTLTGGDVCAVTFNLVPRKRVEG